MIGLTKSKSSFLAVSWYSSIMSVIMEMPLGMNIYIHGEKKEKSLQPDQNSHERTYDVGYYAL